MAQGAAILGRDGETNGGAGRAPRKRTPKPGATRATAGKGQPKRASPRQLPRDPRPWTTAITMSFWIAAVGALAATTTTLMAGHAPSWRSLAVVLLQSVPLWPGFALFWRLLDACRHRFSVLPLAFWLGCAFIGSFAVMLICPGLVFAVHARSAAYAEDFDGEMQIVHHIFGTAYALALYVSTAFRLWWPWGAALPGLMTILFWRSTRR
jgi:hypothetical protein